MASFATNTTQTTAATLGDGDTGFVGPQGAILVSNASAVSGVGSNFLTVLGTVYSYAPLGHGVALAGPELEIAIGDRGTIGSGEGNALDLVATREASLVNAGFLTSSQYTVEVTAGDAAASADIRNSGIIASTGLSGIALQTGTGPASIVNSGEIHGADGAIINRGQTGEITIVNTGLIASDSIALAFLAAAGAGEVLVRNSGTLSAPVNELGFGDDTFINSGLIEGALDMSRGNDSFIGLGGRVTGEVSGGEGDDTYTIDDPGIQLVEDFDEGFDDVRSAVSWALGNNFERLTLIGDQPIDGYGGNSSSRIDGNLADNTLVVRGGQGFLDGKEGDDTLIGGRDGDTLIGGLGDDQMVGRSGDDRFVFGSGDDTIFGGAGNDTVSLLGSQPIRLDDDLLTVGTGTARLVSVETIFGSSQGDTFNADGSAQTFRTFGGDDTVFGGSGNDFIEGGEGADSLFGGFGFDTLEYSGSAQAVRVSLIDGTASGGDAEGDSFDSFEHLTGSENADTLAGGQFSNILTGRGGDDLIGGRSGNDTILGGSGNDRLFGENGNDRIEGGDGDDTLGGGNGFDVFVFRPGDDDDLIRFWDGSAEFIEFSGFGYADATAAYADFSQVGADTVWQNGTDSITLEGVTLNVDISVSDIIV